MQSARPARKASTVRKHIPPVLAAVCCVLWALQSHAAPYTPAKGDEIVADIPSTNPQARGARALQKLAKQRPGDLDLAVRAATADMALAMSESDPRYAGHAEATLAPWWAQKEPPSDMQMLRASILQNRHEFGAAAKDLDDLIAREPRNIQALLTRAVIRQVQGNLAAADADCVTLAGVHPGLIPNTCRALVAGLDGHGAEALNTLDRDVAKDAPDESPQIVLWALTLLAETAERLGRADAAEAYFKAAFHLGLKDGYLTTAYADFLLAQSRPAEVVEMLKSSTAVDPFMLRLTEAEKQLGLPVWQAHADDLAQRFADARARGDVVHRREEARFTLRLRGDGAASLKLAQANWKVQHEPADALVFLEAAAAADPAAAKPVLDWMTAHHLEDVRSEPLVQKLTAGKS